jgi:cation:H+ antiporter
MSTLFWFIVLVISLFVLVKASDYFVSAAGEITHYTGMSHFIVGVIILGFGTSIPELITSIIAVTKDSSEIVIGNVLGSNIANVFLVFSIALIIKKRISLNCSLKRIDIIVLIGSIVMLTIMIIDNKFSIWDAIICIICLSVYLLTSLQNGENEKVDKKKKLDVKSYLSIFASPFFIFLGAQYTIVAVIEISKILSVDTEILALSVVALGTSLPELMVTIVATKKGCPEMAIGNIAGSNIFNTLAVMGIPALFGPLIIPNSIITFSLPISILASFLYVLMVLQKRINRWEGILLLICYIAFISGLYIRA